MEKVMIGAINGRYCTDHKGRKLEIISNISLFSGAMAYTDGKYVYGYELFDTRYPAMFSAAVTGNLVINMLDAYYGLGYFSIYDYDKTQCNLLVYDDYNTQLTDDNIWYGRPYFSQENQLPFALKGNWNRPNWYNANGTIDAEKSAMAAGKLYLKWDKGAGNCWQDGDVCQNKWHFNDIPYYERPEETVTQEWIVDEPEQVDPITGDVIPEVGHWKYTHTWDMPTANWNDYFIFACDGVKYLMQGESLQAESGQARTKSNLRIVTDIAGNVNVNVSSMVSDVLNRLEYMQQQYAFDAGYLLGDAYPYNLPPPIIFGYWLGSVPDELQNVYAYSKLGYWDDHDFNVPCDSDYGQGGIPTRRSTVEADYDTYTGYADCPLGKDYRQIWALRKTGNSFDYYVVLQGRYVQYGYWKDLDYVEPAPGSTDEIEYDPAGASADSWLWQEGYYDEYGSFVDGEAGYFEAIFHVTGNHANCVVFNGERVASDSRQFDNGWAWHVSYAGQGNLRYNGDNVANYSWVLDVVSAGNNQYYVIGNDGSNNCIAVYEVGDNNTVTLKDKQNLYQLYAGKCYNTQWVTIADTSSIITAYNLLKNIPWYPNM